jgi:hypothetical protein
MDARISGAVLLLLAGCATATERQCGTAEQAIAMTRRYEELPVGRGAEQHAHKLLTVGPATWSLFEIGDDGEVCLGAHGITLRGAN